MSFTHEIFFKPAWDKRNAEKNYGIHGVECWFILTGEHGAVTWEILTQWLLPEVQEEQEAKAIYEFADCLLHGTMPHPLYDPETALRILCRPIPAVLAIHSLTPWEPDEERGSDTCEYLKGRPCYTRETYISDRHMDILRREGSDGVWRALEAEYRENFPDCPATEQLKVEG